jgi:hypothetical protein
MLIPFFDRCILAHKRRDSTPEAVSSQISFLYLALFCIEGENRYLILTFINGGGFENEERAFS